MAYERKSKPGGFVVYQPTVNVLSACTVSTVGEVFQAAGKYFNDGIEPKFADDATALLWSLLKNDIDSSTERFFARCEKNSQNAKNRWAQQSNATASDRMQSDATAYNGMQSMPIESNRIELNRKESNRNGGENDLPKRKHRPSPYDELN